MINEITIDAIQETGFTSWGDFLINIQQISFAQQAATYFYHNPAHEFKSITLQISQSNIERLALEEGKIWLNMLKINSFQDLINEIASKNALQNRAYSTEIIVHTSNNRIVFRRLTFETRLIERLANIEKANSDYLTYHEPKKYI